jgi:hypothetical protein
MYARVSDVWDLCEQQASASWPAGASLEFPAPEDFEMTCCAASSPDLLVQVVNQTGSLTLADRGRITTGLEYYFGAFGTTVTLDEIIDQVCSSSQKILQQLPRQLLRGVINLRFCRQS